MPSATIGTIDLYYEVSGHGPPLVCVPGWTLNHRLWDLVAPLVERRFTLIRPDARGTGRSSSGKHLEYSRVADAEDLAGLLDGLGIATAHLVGHSKGARTAMVFAMRYPERSLSVSCIGSAEPHPSAGPPTFRSVARAWAEKARTEARQRGPEAAVAMLGSAKLLGKMRASPSRVRQLRRAMEGYRADDLLSEVSVRDFDTDAGVGRLSCPVLFMAGDQDPFLPECRYAHDRVPGSRLTVLEGCGHMAPLENPERVAAALLAFLPDSP